MFERADKDACGLLDRHEKRLSKILEIQHDLSLAAKELIAQELAQIGYVFLWRFHRATQQKGQQE